MTHKLAKVNTLTAIIFTTAVVLGLANIVASNAVATTGTRLQHLQVQAQELAKTNQDLEQLIAQKQSLTYLSQKAPELGLLPIVTTLNLSTPKPLANLAH